MRLRMLTAAGLMAMVATIAVPVLAQQVTTESVDGIRNFRRLETTIACAGAITAESVPEIKKFGFVSIINLRLASEPGAEVKKEAAAAEAAGLRYFHIPFSGQSPDPAVAGQFLDAISSAGAEPAFVHCAGGNRAAVMWMIKRIAIDHWEVDRAVAEAEALGMTSETLRAFAIQYAQANHRF